MVGLPSPTVVWLVLSKVEGYFNRPLIKNNIIRLSLQLLLEYETSMAKFSLKIPKAPPAGGFVIVSSIWPKK
jgi:hypothetical protein